jgi:hypothetical protein
MRKRTHLRGFLLGYVIHFAVGLLFAYIEVQVLRAISATHGTENPLRTGPLPPLTVAWAVSQTWIFASGIAGGIAAAYWAPARSWYAPAFIALTSLVMAAPNLPKTGGFAVQAIWLLITPVGVVLGAYIYSQFLESRSQQVAPEQSS